MAITTKTPKINRIIRMTEFDKLRTAYSANTLYMCTDTMLMYYDESPIKQKQPFAYIGVKTINDLLYNITPNIGTHYYCWEDNSLWYWNRRWINEWSDSRYPSAYVYDTPPTVDSPSDLDGVYNHDYVLDNNGLLGDGSVVIRDRNRIIKGKIHINDSNDNLVFSSFLGGGIRFLPNGKMDTDGELLIGDEGKSIWRTELSLLNNESYVDYTENPELDNNPYKNDTHRYKIFHEGNLDASDIKVLTPQDIYTKLLDPSLPNTFDFNVSHVGGKTIDEISLVGHKHTSTDITDFNTASRKQAAIEVKSVMDTLAGDGVTVTHDSINDKYKISANNFKLSFGGGASGNGTITHLTDTAIQLTVDPSKHVHDNYIKRMDDLQKQISQIDAMDKNDYYTKTQTDTIVNNVKGTTTPVSGKPLLVNSNLELPGTATASTKFNSAKTVNFTGDITGTLSTDFSGTTNVALNAANIVSTTPTEGKALLVDKNGNLPGNSETSSALDHTIQINLLKQVVGTGTLDTSKNKVDINCTLQPGDNILQTKDLGVTVANIDTSTGKIPSSLIPQIEGSLTPKGSFDPANGYPSTNPSEGDFWIASTNGTLGGETYSKGDWLVYVNSEWTHIQLLNSVSSVNGKTGAVTLNANDVNAISKTLITYNSGDQIPNGYVVKTSANGQITGAKIEALIDKFSIATDNNSAVQILSNSSNTQTDGTQDLGLNLGITTKGYTDIKNQVGFDIQNHGVTLAHSKYINFSTGLSAKISGNSIVVESDGDIGSYAGIFLDRKNTAGVLNDVKNKINMMYPDRSTKPFILTVLTTNGKVINYVIDDNNPDLPVSGSITLTSEPYITSESDNIGVIIKQTTYSLTLTTDANGEVSSIGGDISTTKTLGKFLTTVKPDTVTSMTTFTPTQDWHPVSKKYVDDKVSGVTFKRYTTLIGNGTATSYTVTHNLNSKNVIVQCRLESTGEQVFVSNKIVDANKVQIDFNTVPASNSIRVNVI